MKPVKTLKGATFMGQGLYARHPDPARYMDCIKTSKVIARLGPNRFETVNTIYDVEWAPGAEITIPDEWKHYG